MKWFDRWFAEKYRWARNNLNETVRAEPVRSDPHGLNDGMSINLKQVIGGRLVTFHYYDRQRDENHNRTYIITDEQDFERELGKIITLEAMRQ